ncbi:MAG TPA: methionyl-tRNA formyltransferase [Candidatus Paceibacterota bacterium]|nr:methionyl-tRNA formyltransferase [Candidatus Paceibacterota bacterium]
MNNKENKLNFVFFGTPDVASETLEILMQNGYVPSLIITSPDAQKGRGLRMQASPVSIFAEKNDIACIKPEKLDEDFSKKLEAMGCKLFIVVAYGKIIPEKILNMPKLGSINIHYSLLPKYRGASPVESAILNGDSHTGVSIQKMEFKMDSGPIIAHSVVPVLGNEKAPELRKRLIKIGGELLVKILPEFTAGRIKEMPQVENEATYSKKIKKGDGLVNLDVESPRVLYNKWRAYAQWPRTFFFRNSKRIIITDAALENGQFVIKKVLPEGKKEISWEDFNLRYSVD